MSCPIRSDDRCDWVEIIEPRCKEKMFVNLSTGDCQWELPPNVLVKKMDRNQWWELIDTKTNRFYYYNAQSQQTVWQKPTKADIIPLAKLQIMRQNTEVGVEPPRRGIPLQTSGNAALAKPRRSLDLGKRRAQSFRAIDCDSSAKLGHKSAFTRHSAGLSHSFLHLKGLSESKEEKSNNLKNSPAILVLEKEKEKDSDPVQNADERCTSAQGAPIVWTPVQKTSTGGTLPPRPPMVNNNCIPQQQPQLRCPAPALDSRLRGFEEQCTVSEASVDSGLPPDNASWDSLDGGTESGQPSSLPAGIMGGQLPLRPSALAMGVSGLRGTPQTRRFAFPRTNPAYRRPSDVGRLDQQRTPNRDYACNNNLLRVQQYSLPLPPPTSASGERCSSAQRLACTGTAGSDVSESMTTTVMTSPGGHTSESSSTERCSPQSICGNSVGALEAGNSCGGSSTGMGGGGGGNRWQSAASMVTSSAGGEGGGVRSLSPQPIYYQAHVPPNHTSIVASHPATSIIQQQQQIPTATVLSGTPGLHRQMSLQQHHGSQHNYAAPLPGWNLNLFRKDQQPTKLLSWTKESLHKPMLISTDKLMKKDACESFKQLQMYMGDRKSKAPAGDLMFNLLQKGWSTPPLRDELFVQLCKQTTNNPDEISASRGWELLCSCLDFFPPSSRLQPYLEGYILRELHPPQVGEAPPPALVSRFAKVAAQRVRRSAQLGARQGNHPLTMTEVQQAKQSILMANMFGNNLESLMSLQLDRFPQRRLPWILVALSEEVLRRNGPQTEGIFLCPCDGESLINLRSACCYRWETNCAGPPDPHVPANLLKQWLLELAEPLLPQGLQTLALNVANRPQEATGLLDRLSQLNRASLAFLVRFLQVFSVEEISQTTKMDASRLAQVFAPCIFHHTSNASTPSTGSVDTILLHAVFLRTLIIHLDTTDMEGIC